MNTKSMFITFIAAIFLAAALTVQGGDRPLLGIADDMDGDGVPDSVDACPSVDASFFDRDGDGCVDDPVGARHTEYWAADQLPFVYWICADGAPGITDGSEFTALQDAVGAWAAIPGVDFTVSYAGTTPQQDADALDRINLITFSDDTYPFPTAVLAVGISTSFTVDSTYNGTYYRPGQIVDADMIFNPLKTLRTPTSGTGTIDVQSVATHEAAHLFGISHSPVRTSTMFYVLPPGTNAASLETEDELIFLKAYGDPTALALLNRIDGTVTDGQTGAGVPGVIVCAVDVASGDTVAGDYTLPDGSWSFVGLPDGGYYIGIHPLDGSSAIAYLEPSYINTLVDTTAVTAVVAEWWDSAESNNDDSAAKDAISLGGGQTVTGLEIVTNIDAEAPEVTQLTPQQAATGVLISAALKITFSEPIDYTTISGNFEVADASGGFVTGSVAVLNDDSVLAFTPSGAYDFSTDYTLTLSPGLKDKFGNGLDGPFVSSFTTEAAPPLGIQYLSPNKGVVGTKVVISGTGFAWNPVDNIVMFGAAQAEVNSAYPFRLVVTVPHGAQTGLVTVTTTEGTSNGLTYTILSQEEIARGFQSGVTELGATPRMLTVLPDGSFAYVATSFGAASVVIDPGQAGYLDVGPVPIVGGLSEVAAMPGQKLVYGTGVTSGKIHVIDADPQHIGLFNTVLVELDCGAVPLGIAIEPSGGKAYVPTDEGEIQVWDVRLGSATYHEQIGSIVVDEPSLRGGIAVDPAGERLLALTGTGKLLVYDLGPDTLVASIAVSAEPRRVLVEPAGTRCYVSDGAGAVAVVSLPGTPFKVQDLTTGGALRGMTVTPAGMYLYAANRNYKLLDVIDLNEESPTFWSVVATVDFDGQPVDVEVSPDGFYAFSLLEDSGQLVVTTIGLGPTLRSMSRRSGLPGHQIVLAGDFLGSPPGLGVSFSGQGGTNIEVLPSFVNPGTSISVTVPPGTVSGPVFVTTYGSEEMTDVTGVSNSLYFEILQPAVESRQRLAARVSPGPWEINDALDVSPTGDFIAVGGGTGELAIIDIDPTSPYFNLIINTFRVSGGPVEEIAITPDGERAFMALPDDSTSLRVYNVNVHSSRYGKPVGQVDFGTHNAEEITECAVSPDGEILLLTDWTAGLVFVTDIREGSATEYQVLTALDLAHCTSIAFHPAGRYAYLTDWTQRAIVVLNLDPFDAEYLTIGPTLVMPGYPPPAALGLDVTPDGGWLYALTSQYDAPSAETVFRYDLSDPANPAFDPDLLLSLPTGRDQPGLEKIVISPRGDRAVAAIHYGGYYLIDLTADPDTMLSGLFDFAILTPPDIEFTPDASRLYATGSVYDSIYVYDFTDAAHLYEISGNFQNGVVDQFLQAPLRVSVMSSAGDSVAGVPVTFRIDSGGGQFPGNLAEQVVATDGNGYATAEWQLGPIEGVQLVYAEAIGLDGSPVAFEAYASADPGTLPLAVSQALPIPYSTGVSVTTSAQVTFSRPVDPLSIDSGTLFLVPSGDVTPIDVVTGYADGNRKVTLIPSSPLDFSDDYVLTFTSDILDENGDTLTNPGVSQFATAARPPVQIASISPPGGVAGINVVIAGAGFSPVPAENTVLFSGASAIPLDASVDYLIVRVPLSALPGPVRVVAYGDTSNARQFTVLVPSTSPIDEVVATVGTGSTTKSVTVTPDGAIAYSVSPDGDVVVPIDVEGQNTYPSIPVGDNPIAIVMHPDGTFAYVANLGSGTVSVIGVDPDDAVTFNTIVTTISVGTNPVDLAAGPDGDRVYVANAGSASLSVIDSDDQSATQHSVVATVGTGTTARSVTVTPDGARIYIGTDTGYLVVDAMTNAVTATVTTGSTAKSVTVTPDGGLLVLLTTEGEVLLIDIEEGSSSENQVVARVGTGSTTTSVTVSPDGALLYLIMEDSDLVVVYSLAIVGSIGALDPWVIIPPKTVEISPVDSIPTGTGPADIAVDPSGSGMAIITNAGDNTVTILNASSVPLGPLSALIRVTPRTLNLDSKGRWITGMIQLPPAYFPEEIDISSILLQDEIPVVPGKWAIGDCDFDGIRELEVKFDRAAFQQIMPLGEYVPVTITGTARGRPFAGEDTIRTIRPTVTHPAHGAVQWGEQVVITWTSPSGWTVDAVDVIWSSDDGETWSPVVLQVPDEGYALWTAPFEQHEKCRAMVILYRDGEDIGAGMSPEAFPILAPVAVALQRFEGEPSEDGAVLRWETSLETNTTGFSIERGESEDGSYEPLDGGFVPATGSPTGARYEFCDTTVTLNRSYWYVLREVSDGGSKFVFGPYKVTVRAPFSLAQNAPNPFNPVTAIKFTIPHDSEAFLAVYDVSGRRIRTLVDRRLRADFYRVEWDGTNDEGRQVASGIYFYRLTAGPYSQSRKMVLLR